MGVDEKVGDVLVNDKIKPKFRDISELTHEQLTDPDYRLKEVQKLAGEYNFDITCSKCHHCR